MRTFTGVWIFTVQRWVIRVHLCQMFNKDTMFFLSFNHDIHKILFTLFHQLLQTPKLIDIVIALWYLLLFLSIYPSSLFLFSQNKKTNVQLLSTYIHIWIMLVILVFQCPYIIWLILLLIVCAKTMTKCYILCFACIALSEQLCHDM